MAAWSESALVTVSTSAYLIAFGCVLVAIGQALVRDLYGAAQNVARRFSSTVVTARVVGGGMVFIGAVALAGGVARAV